MFLWITWVCYEVRSIPLLEGRTCFQLLSERSNTSDFIWFNLKWIQAHISDLSWRALTYCQEEKRHVSSVNPLGLDTNQEKEAKEKEIPEHVWRLISHTSLLQFPQSPPMMPTLLKYLSGPWSRYTAYGWAYISYHWLENKRQKWA